MNKYVSSLLIVVLVSLTANPVNALSKTSCSTDKKGNEYCFTMNTPDRNNWTWQESWTFFSPYKKNNYDTIKVKIIMFGGYFTCNPRFSKVTSYQEKDEYGRLINIRKGELQNSIFLMEKSLRNRMQGACK